MKRLRYEGQPGTSIKTFALLSNAFNVASVPTRPCTKVHFKRPYLEYLYLNIPLNSHAKFMT